MNSNGPRQTMVSDSALLPGEKRSAENGSANDVRATAAKLAVAVSVPSNDLVEHSRGFQVSNGGVAVPGFELANNPENGLAVSESVVASSQRSSKQSGPAIRRYTTLSLISATRDRSHSQQQGSSQCRRLTPPPFNSSSEASNGCDRIVRINSLGGSDEDNNPI